MKELEHQSLKNLHILGSKMGDCASVAVARLSTDVKLGASATNSNNQKFRYVIRTVFITTCNKLSYYFSSFKWGTKPIMELSLAMGHHQSNAMWLCFVIWLFIIFMIFSPFSS